MDKKGQNLQNRCAEFVLSNTYISGYYKIVDKIIELQKIDSDAEIVLIVPDKFSLNAEQIFMERSGLSSLFNVWITTLSRFVAKVLDSEEQKFKLLSKNSGTMLVSKIITENIDKIGTYKKVANNYALSETMFNVINLLKSSGVRPEELLNNFDDTNFGLKIKDIYLVYNEYEKQMKEHIDATTRLEIFDKKVKNSEFVKNQHIFFAMFESFTNVQNNSLANLAKCAKSFTISLCANTIQNNAYIFDNTVFGGLRGAFDDSHIKYEIVNIDDQTTQLNSYLSKNLFGLKDTVFETDRVKLIECSNIASEVRYVASKIKFLLLEKKCGFDDINVAVNGIDDYKLTIKKVFDEFDFSYYLEEQKTVLEHYFSRTILDVADFVCGQKTIAKAITIVESPLFEIDGKKKYDFQIYLQKYNIFGEELFSQFCIKDEFFENAEEVRNLVFEKIKTLEISLKNAKTISDKTSVLIEYFEQIDAKNVIENLSQTETDMVQKQIDCMIYQKFVDALCEAQDLVGDSECDLSNYFDMLKSAMNGTNLISSPIRCDAIFVGDASHSTFAQKKYMFVLGATQSRMPANQNDSGTITDSEIAIFKASSRISPTIKQLNKREKFKLFNLMLMFTERLEVLFSTLTNGQIEFKSEFVQELSNKLTCEQKPLAIEKLDLMDYKEEFAQKSTSSAYKIGTLKNAILLHKQSKLNETESKALSQYLQSAENQYLETADRFKLENAKQKLFGGEKTSSSQIERYFKCPFMQFVDYALKPKDMPKFEVSKIDIGLVLHSVAEKFVERYIQNKFKFDDDIEKLSLNIFDEIIQDEKYNSLSKNVYAINSLKAEAVRFCLAIKNQVECSEFVPTFVEKGFANFKISNGLSLSGVVDRIDVYDDNISNEKYLRIIDYKSGKNAFSYQDVFYGIKLQLLLYTKVICESMNTSSAMIAYMPVKNNFGSLDDEEFSSYKLSGVMLKNNGVVYKLDKNLESQKSSNIIDIEFNKDGSFAKKCQKNMLEKTDFDILLKYALDVLTKATDEMIEGYIMPKPFKNIKTNACSFCKYKSLCHYDFEKDGYRELKTKSLDDFKNN